MGSNARILPRLTNGKARVDSVVRFHAHRKLFSYGSVFRLYVPS